MTSLLNEPRVDINGEPRRFTTAEYHKMGEIGILGQGVELIEGVVYVKGLGKPWHWTCDDYDRMYQEGIIDRDERVELIDGEVITLAPIGPGHRNSVMRLTRILIRLEDAFGPNFTVAAETPIKMGGDVKPQADIAVVARSIDDLELRDFVPSDVRLIIEVSNTTLRTDRTVKYRRYAEVGIPEYWIVNLRDRQLEVYRDPLGDKYRLALVYGLDDTVAPLFAPTVPIAVADFLPRSA